MGLIKDILLGGFVILIILIGLYLLPLVTYSNEAFDFGIFDFNVFSQLIILAIIASLFVLASWIAMLATE